MDSNPKDRPQLILASSSPRRQEMFERLGFDFLSLKPDVEEKHQKGEDPFTYSLRNAVTKGEWVKSKLIEAKKHTDRGFIVVSADTIVVIKEKILEKPENTEHAREMLRFLSGNTHQVISAVHLCGSFPKRKEFTKSFTVTTEVTIKRLTEDEICWYVATGEPMDKAGSYAAQGIGSYMVESLSGSYTNVVGLPLSETLGALERDFGYSLW